MVNQHTNPWTEDQNEKLMDLVSTYIKLPEIATRLGRSVRAVERQMERLGVANRHLEIGALTANQLAQCLNVDASTVIRHIKKHGLPAKKVYLKGKVSKNQPYYIDVNEFWKWADKNRELIRWSKIERRTLLPEPEWLNEQIKIDYDKPKRMRKPWTDIEDKQLMNLYFKDGLPQKEVARILNRTTVSIEKRVKRLRERNNQEAKS